MVYYHEILPWVNMVLGKTIIPKLNLLPVSLAPSLHSWIWALCTALVEHPVLSCHYLLPHSFHSLLTGLMAFILELLNTRGNQSNITKSQYSSMALMIKIKTSLHISQGFVWTPLPPPRPLILPPSFLSLVLYAPSPLASCCSLNCHGVFLPQNLYTCCSLFLKCSSSRFQHGCTPPPLNAIQISI